MQWTASPALVTETVSSSRKLGSNEKFTVFVVAADQSSGHVTCAERFQNSRHLQNFRILYSSLPLQARASFRSEYKSNLQRFLYGLLNCLLFTRLTHDFLQKWFENTMLAKEAVPSTKNKSKNNNSINNNHSTLTLFLNTLKSRSIYWRGGRLCSSGLRRDRQ